MCSYRSLFDEVKTYKKVPVFGSPCSNSAMDLQLLLVPRLVIVLIMIMRDGWDLQQWPTSPITTNTT